MLVTTDVPGCRELVIMASTGIRPRERRSAATARPLDTTGADRALGAAARRKVLAEFDERIVIEKTLAVYRELVG